MIFINLQSITEIRELVNNGHLVFPEPGYECYHGNWKLIYCYFRPFFWTTKECVEKYFKENNIVSLVIKYGVYVLCTLLFQDPKFDYCMFVHYVVFLVTSLAGWFGIVSVTYMYCIQTQILLMHTSTHAQTHTCMHACRHAHTRTHTHTHTHTHNILSSSFYQH